jgi:hypothetical protein
MTIKKSIRVIIYAILASVINISLLAAFEPGEKWQFIPEYIIYRPNPSKFSQTFLFSVQKEEEEFVFPYRKATGLMKEDTKEIDYLKMIEFVDKEFLIVDRVHSGSSRGVFHEFKMERSGIFLNIPAGLAVHYLLFLGEDREKKLVEFYVDGMMLRCREWAYYFDTVGTVEIIYRIDIEGSNIPKMFIDEKYLGPSDIYRTLR